MKTHASQSRPNNCTPTHTDSAAHPVTTRLTGLLNNVTTTFYTFWHSYLSECFAPLDSYGLRFRRTEEQSSERSTL